MLFFNWFCVGGYLISTLNSINLPILFWKIIVLFLSQQKVNSLRNMNTKQCLDAAFYMNISTSEDKIFDFLSGKSLKYCAVVFDNICIYVLICLLSIKYIIYESNICTQCHYGCNTFWLSFLAFSFAWAPSSPCPFFVAVSGNASPLSWAWVAPFVCLCFAMLPALL